jgi:hypothetical protein
MKFPVLFPVSREFRNSRWGTAMRQGAGPCNELNPNVFRFDAGSGRQPALTVLGKCGAQGVERGTFHE